MYSHLPKCPGIYLISDKKSGKFYIGSSINIRRRITQHVYSLNKNKHSNPIMQAIWNVDASRLDFSCLESLDGADKEVLLKTEQKYLDNSCVGKNPLCINILMVANSHLGIKRRPESIEKLRKANIGRKTSEKTKEKQRAAKLGKKLSEEHKQKIGNACRGKKINRPKGIIQPKLRKLSDDAVRSLRKLRGEGCSWQQLSNTFFIAKGVAKRIALGITYQNVK